jgi:protein-S-isoprenylcysteine O-methyltransferase Ste14
MIFLPAGELKWSEGWIYFIIQALFSGFIAIFLKRTNPQLLVNRLDVFKASGKKWDKILMLLTAPFYFGAFIISGLDAVRFGWSNVPKWLEIIGFCGFLAGLIIFYLVIKENAFLSRVVEIQTERGHKVVSTGPYRFVRHPMYVGLILMYIGIPLWLGSYYALIFSLIVIISLLIRTYKEDATLKNELEGYSSYAEKVCYRWIPGIW